MLGSRFTLIALAVGFATPLLAEQKPAPSFEPTHPWLHDLDEAFAASKKSKKPILVEFR